MSREVWVGSVDGLLVVYPSSALGDDPSGGWRAALSPLLPFLRSTPGSRLRAQLGREASWAGRQPGEDLERGGMHQDVDVLDARGLAAMSSQGAAMAEIARLLAPIDVLFVPTDVVVVGVRFGEIHVDALARLDDAVSRVVRDMRLTPDELEFGREGADDAIGRAIYDVGVLAHALTRAKACGGCLLITG